MKNNEYIAIFWDYENAKVYSQGFKAPLAESLIDYVKSVGHPQVKKVYSNWVAVRNETIVQALYSLGFEPIQVSMGKVNSVDVKIAVDCLDTAINNPDIKTFMIVTGDKDFIPVVNWLKDHEKKVIIIGNTNSVSDHLLLSSDGFISLKELSKVHEKSVQKEEIISFDEAVNCLVSVIKTNRKLGKSTRFLVLNDYMRSTEHYNYESYSLVRKPDSSGTFHSFKEFIEEAESRNRIKSITIEGFREIFLPDENPAKESDLNPELSKTVTRTDAIRICKELRQMFNDNIIGDAENKLGYQEITIALK
ncbi:MAG: NYN domain-containing protein, partial [Candidatus Lokiarchaeota archaeon]|nr:NYN domain-containing protein [Candidatus Lokiarchaeota archaeon]